MNYIVFQFSESIILSRKTIHLLSVIIVLTLYNYGTAINTLRKNESNSSPFHVCIIL